MAGAASGGELQLVAHDRLLECWLTPWSHPWWWRCGGGGGSGAADRYLGWQWLALVVVTAVSTSIRKMGCVTTVGEVLEAVVASPLGTLL